MQRQTRRRTAVADATDVSQMDPWKDDRCRDFIALNTIQRLRSYHSDTLLPVEPVNSIRAKNLVLLPMAEPDERTCETEEGCAIDTARILFFGPTAFTSLTSQGRMTASPHGGGHSGSRTSFPQSEEMTKLSPIKGGLQTPTTSLNSQLHDSAHRHGELKTTTGEDGTTTMSSDPDDKKQEIHTDVFDAGATPLRRLMNDTEATPAPHPPEESASGTITAYEEYSGNGKEEHNIRSSATGVVKFSCAIVEAIVAYYQSLLTRGVVLDRFNAKDLAFSWWVVGRNMNVAALHQHSAAPMRRDALTILVRHFYYELLTEHRPKKSLWTSPVDSPQKYPGKEEKDSTSHASEEEGGGGDARKKTHASEIKQRHSTSTTMSTSTSGANTIMMTEAEERIGKRPRSRLDPTRTSPPPCSSRLRRQLNMDKNAKKEKEAVEEEKETVNEEAESSAEVTTTTFTVTNSRTKRTSRQATKGKEKVAVDAQTDGATTQSTSSVVESTTKKKPQDFASNNNNNNSNTTNITGEVVSTVEKTNRPPRSAIIEEVWRPIRSTRRRLVPSENSSDFVEAASTVTEKRHDSVYFLNLVVERIQERMAKDSIYADLLTGFSDVNSVMKSGKEEERRSGSSKKINNKRRTCQYGMHPALMQLSRYHHTFSPESSVPRQEANRIKKEALEAEDEEGKGATVEEKTSFVEGEKGEELLLSQQHQKKKKSLPCDEREVSPTHSHNMDSHLGSVVKTEEGKDEEEDEHNISPGANDVKMENHLNGNTTALPLQLPCSLSSLTYAQRCLLTWEASLILNPLQPLPEKKSHATSNNAESNLKPPSTPRQRHYYDYWRNP